jgi:RNA polymerase sigma-70 factor (ECF subfamily)
MLASEASKNVREDVDNKPSTAARWEDMSDPMLLTGIHAGIHEAFAALVDRHSPRFYRLAYRITHHREDAEDVVQEAFLKLWKEPHLWDSTRDTRFTTWFYRMVTNRALDLTAARKPSEDIAGIALAIEGEEKETQIDAKRRVERVERALAALHPNQRAALALCFYEERSHKEAAEILGMSVKALQSLLMRSKAALKRILQPPKYEES